MNRSLITNDWLLHIGCHGYSCRKVADSISCWKIGTHRHTHTHFWFNPLTFCSSAHWKSSTLTSVCTFYLKNPQNKLLVKYNSRNSLRLHPAMSANLVFLVKKSQSSLGSASGHGRQMLLSWSRISRAPSSGFNYHTEEEGLQSRQITVFSQEHTLRGQITIITFSFQRWTFLTLSENMFYIYTHTHKQGKHRVRV